MTIGNISYKTILGLTLSLAVAMPPSLAQEQAPTEKKTTEKKKKPSKKDVDAIGERDVGKGMNWYSIEKEIALGKGLAQEIERQAKIVDDPVIAEYINQIGRASCRERV